ncbi:Hca operon transcriptional activator HcaR [Streptomyces sp. enrichment culture]|uniref:LysR family transcriptional regulator n=1 Tax=Streptomyces sp. enrichment culture TaxID=1795815 RepID=UPI003F574BD1
MGMTKDVHVRDLRCFLAVAEDLHFTRAAERLHVSQPALSKQIRALERQLGVELFRRGRHGVALTDAGTALLPHARQVLDAWREAADAVDAVRTGRRGTLVVGMSTSPVRGGLLPAVRSRFTAAHPDAALRLRQVDWQDPTAGLADGTVDVAFVWLPLPGPDRYAWTLVAQEPLMVALPDTHPLAAREAVDFPDLLDEPFLALPPSAGALRDFWLAPEFREGRPLRVGAEVAGTEETYEALAAGLGVCLIAEGNVPLLTLGGVTARPVRGLPPARYVLAWRREDGDRPLVRAYARACREVAERAWRAEARQGRGPRPAPAAPPAPITSVPAPLDGHLPPS